MKTTLNQYTALENLAGQSACPTGAGPGAMEISSTKQRSAGQPAAQDFVSSFSPPVIETFTEEAIARFVQRAVAAELEVYWSDGARSLALTSVSSAKEVAS